MCQAGQQRLTHITRFDMPGFRPTAGYVREMKRFGILPKDLAEGSRIDVYATDRAYRCELGLRRPTNEFRGLGQPQPKDSG